MSRMHSKAKLALVAALGILLAGGGTAGVLSAQARQATGQQTGRESAEDGERAPYRSSIQVPDDENGEKGEGDEADEKGEGSESNGPEEQAETARLQSLARISLDEARRAALAQVPGTITSSGIENEDGNLVYGVTVKTADGERDVKVDAGNGKVLHVEKDGDND